SGAKAADEAEPKSEPTSLSKSDQPEDAKPAAAAKKVPPKPGTGGRSKAQSGQRKGQQRPKSPSKK
ncbi:MAG TPA: membrane protein insertase YidC, partial [Streptomyces sp.]|nr:membrane protein insertase YidC [Streptomyces sp.]